MNAIERKSAILDVLCRQRHTTTAELAEMFEVTERTIRNDITDLSCSYPIRTVRGRYGGGICLENWYQPHLKSLSSRQVQLLKKLQPTLCGDDLAVLNSILAQFGPRMDDKHGEAGP